MNIAYAELAGTDKPFAVGIACVAAAFLTVLLATMLLAAFAISSATAETELSEADIAYEKRFNEISQAGVKLDYHPALDGPWGSPHPDAAPELEQFAFDFSVHQSRLPCRRSRRGG